VLFACLAQTAAIREIAARVNLPRSLVSHHLRLLRASRLRATRNGKQMIYASVGDRVRCIVVDLLGHVVKPLAGDEDDHELGARSSYPPGLLVGMAYDWLDDH
jgi:hypothetical protein